MQQNNLTDSPSTQASIVQDQQPQYASRYSFAPVGYRPRPENLYTYLRHCIFYTCCINSVDGRNGFWQSTGLNLTSGTSGVYPFRLQHSRSVIVSGLKDEKKNTSDGRVDWDCGLSKLTSPQIWNKTTIKTNRLPGGWHFLKPLQGGIRSMS